MCTCIIGKWITTVMTSESIEPEGEPFRVQNPVKPWWERVLSVIKLIFAFAQCAILIIRHSPSKTECISASKHLLTEPWCSFFINNLALFQVGLILQTIIMYWQFYKRPPWRWGPWCVFTAQQMLSSFFFFAVVVIEYEHFSFGQQCLSHLT